MRVVVSARDRVACASVDGLREFGEVELFDGGVADLVGELEPGRDALAASFEVLAALRDVVRGDELVGEVKGFVEDGGRVLLVRESGLIGEVSLEVVKEARGVVEKMPRPRYSGSWLGEWVGAEESLTAVRDAIEDDGTLVAEDVGFVFHAVRACGRLPVVLPFELGGPRAVDVEVDVRDPCRVPDSVARAAVEAVRRWIESEEELSSVVDLWQVELEEKGDEAVLRVRPEDFRPCPDVR